MRSESRSIHEHRRRHGQIRIGDDVRVVVEGVVGLGERGKMAARWSRRGGVVVVVVVIEGEVRMERGVDVC